MHVVPADLADMHRRPRAQPSPPPRALLHFPRCSGGPVWVSCSREGAVLLVSGTPVTLSAKAPTIQEPAAWG